MGRPAERDEVVRKTREYLALAEQSSPDDMPIDVKHVAAATGYSRTTLYKYGLREEIQVASDRQTRNAGASPAKQEKNAYEDRIRAAEERAQTAEERCRGLVARFALVEANAARLGFDPEELYKPIPKPDRRTSRAGAKGRRTRR
jgi:hypothetical protein